VSLRPAQLVAPAVVLLLAFVLILAFGAEPGDYQVYVPEGYVHTVDALIAQGKLVYDCQERRVEARGLNAAERYFLDHSYLRRDLATWNGGDPRPFVVEHQELAGGRCRGELLRANASHHNQRLPTYTASGWRGRLFLHQDASTTTLASGERTIEVARAPLALLPLDAAAYEDVWFGGRDDADVRSQKLAFKMLERGRSFATLENLGDPAVLEVIQERPEVMLNGCPVGRGWRLRLESGDAVRLRLPGRLDDRYSVEAGSAAGLLSFVSTVNGERRRKTFSHRLAMADDVARAVDTAVLAGLAASRGSADRGGAGRDDFDVHLALDAFFHDKLGRLTSDFCRRRYGRRPLRAAVTLLEAGTGRVLALASYPAPGDQGRLAYRRAAHRPLLAANHNFQRHPVGSATKPFLAAAALATHPELAELRIPCWSGGGAEPPEELLGYELGEYNLPGDCNGADGEGRVGLEDFLRVSSNRYMLYLGLLSMAEWQNGAPRADREAAELPPQDRYLLAGRPQTRRPVLPIVKDEEDEGTELGDVADQPFVRNFGRLFSGRFQYRSEGAAESLELDYWRPVLAATVGAADAESALAFSPVTPERVNLAANLVQRFRQDLYTLLLGGGNNRWSNLQLAEATARLVGGDWQRRAELVEEVSVPPRRGAGGAAAGETDSAAEPPAEVLWSLPQPDGKAGPDGGAKAAAEPSPLDETLRRRILAGMQAVARPGGTARELAAPLAELNELAPPGVTYRLFAKTGTPTSEPSLLLRSGSVPGPGATEVYSGRRQVKSGVLVLAVERSTADGAAERLVLSLWIEGQGGSEETVDLAAELLRPLVEAYWPADWLRPATG